MATLSAEEEDLLTWLRSSIPRWFWMDEAIKSKAEVWIGAVKSLIQVQLQGEAWNTATFILTATDVWLNQHARDRGTFRQSGELDAVLRTRLRTYEDAVSKSTVLAAVQQVLTDQGVAGTAAIVELKRDKGFFKVLTPNGGSGGSLTKDGDVMTLDTGVALNGYEKGRQITIAGHGTPGNNGTFTVTGVTTNTALTYTNASGAAGAMAAATWQIDSNYNNRRHAYFGRGYRMATAEPSSFVIILPYGATATTTAAVEEALRKKKAGGIGSIVERRTSPP